MPSDNKKGPVKGSDNNVKAISAKKKVSIGWIFGMAILILIAISFVAAPAIEAIVGGSRSNSIVFGSYNGEKIEYAQDSYFYDQYQKYGSEYKGSTTDSNMALYQIWSQAFNSTVLYTAVSQMAKAAGIIETEETINKAIIDSGYYNVDGKFNTEAYNKASTEQKNSIRKTITRVLPYQTVLTDISTALVSDSEAEYVAKMADDTRTFKYVSFDSSLYPKELTAEYALTNPKLFEQVTLNIISAKDKETADSILAEINGGKDFAEVAKDKSEDSYASKGGELGTIPFYAIKSNFKNEDESMNILDAEVGSVIGPFESASGYSIYKVGDKTTPDYTSEDTLNMVRSYITNYDSSIMDNFLQEKAKEFKATIADGDFDSAAKAANLTVNAVNATPKNIGNSQYMSSFSSSDSAQLLANAATDEATLKSLFSADVNTALDPIKSSSSYIVPFVQAEDKSSGMGDYLKSIYPYYASQEVQNDLQNVIMSSDKLENNFLTVFFDRIMSNAN